MSVDEITSNALNGSMGALPQVSHLPYELLKKIVDTMNEGLVVQDKDRKFVFVNRGFRRLSGYQPEDLLGKSITDALDSDNTKIFLQQMEKRRDCLSCNYEMSLVCKDGQKLPLLISAHPIFDDNNNYVGSFAILTDFLDWKLSETEMLLQQHSLEGTLKSRTEEWADIKEQLEQKKAEQSNSDIALKQSRMRFSHITNTIEDVFWITDLKSEQVLYASPAYEKIWSRTVASLYKDPQQWIDAIHPDDRQRILKTLVDIPETGSYDQEYRITRPDGSMKWIRDRGYPVCDEDGQLLNIAGFAEDITDKKQAEFEIASKHRQVQMLSSQMTSIEEHERKLIAEGLHDSIIQPMIFLDIKLGSLASTQRNDEIIQEYKQMRQILAELIEKTRSFTFNLSNPVLYELGLETALEEWLSTEIETKHKLPIVFKASEGLDDLGDDVSVFVLKAVKELMTNIIKHANAKNAFISVARGDTGIEICVKDNGKGFDLNDKKRRHVKGSGLGLFSLKERLVHLGGCFDIKSEPGNGTTVNIRIPISEAGS